MAHHGYIGHVDSTGRNFDARIAAFGYPFATKGENLAAGNPDAAATFRQFEMSAPHRENMLRPEFKVLGVARAYGPGTAFTWYWTTTFGGQSGRSRPC
jgi:uncharacterized protein YkwD